MEGLEESIHNPEKSQMENHEPVTVAVVAEEANDVDKTLYDAEEFLSNFTNLRDENEQLKHANQELEAQLEKCRQDLQQFSIDKDTLENQLLQERQQHKEELWKLREEHQKIQEERLQWKEKYLNACMKSSDQPTELSEASRTKKRKANDTDLYSNLSFVHLNDQNQQPEVILTLVSEDSKSYKISIRECKFCGIGFCSAIGLNQHYRTCEKRYGGRDNDFENAVDCDVCDVKFPSHADLIQHNQFHQGTHRFLCRVCSRSYQSNPGRIKHEQLEHGSTPLLQCDACGKQFKRKDRLKDHIATKHSIETPHKCPYCDMQFKLRDYLRKHVNQFHPGKPISTITHIPSLPNTSPVSSQNNSIASPLSDDHHMVAKHENISPKHEDGAMVSVAKLITTEEGQNKIVQVVVPISQEE